MKKETNIFEHETVLQDETVDGLKLKRGDTAVDATAGGGGHALALSKKINDGTLVVIDVDPQAIEDSKRKLQAEKSHVIYIRGNYRNLKSLVQSVGIHDVDGIVFDLGWRMEQLYSGKGLSFRQEEPLSMQLGLQGGITAKDIIAGWDEHEIEQIIREYGEERFSKRIAHAIVTERRKHAINTTTELAEVIFQAVPAFYKRGRIHPATKTFQSLRIRVNDELESLRMGLRDALEILSDGGKVAVISFHSLEDRIVKNLFRDAEKNGAGKRLTKKPITPSLLEIKRNPRSRSAKLRIFERKHGTI